MSKLTGEQNGASKSERYENAIEWLLDQLNDQRTPMDTKIKIALALVKIQEARHADVGKKQRAKRAAQEAAQNGRFAVPSAPIRTRRGVLVMRPVRDDVTTNVPALATTGTGVATAVDRETTTATLNEALAVLSHGLQQVAEPDDLSIEVDCEPGRFRLRVRAYRRRNGGDGGGDGA